MKKGTTANSEATIQEQAIEYAKAIANKIGKQYKVSEDDLKDLRQEAITESLCQLPRFDQNKNCMLNTFIQKAVEGHLLDYLKRYVRGVHVADDSTLFVNSTENEFNYDDEKAPSLEEKIADIEEEEQRRKKELIDHLRAILKTLPDDERELIMVRFQFNEVNETTSQYMERKGITRSKFYRMSDAIVAKLRRLMGVD